MTIAVSGAGPDEAVIEVACMPSGQGRARPEQSLLLIRGLLADTFGGQIGDWDIGHDEAGAPHALRHGQRFPVFISLSRAEGLAVASICRTAPVGIDVEAPSAHPADALLADAFFSDTEKAALKALPEDERSDLFFRIWTLKEAWVKARGLGLSLDLRSFSVAQPGAFPALALANGGEKGWSLASLALSSGHVIGLAVSASSQRIRLRPVELEQTAAAEAQGNDQPIIVETRRSSSRSLCASPRRTPS